MLFRHMEVLKNNSQLIIIIIKLQLGKTQICSTVLESATIHVVRNGFLTLLIEAAPIRYLLVVASAPQP